MRTSLLLGFLLLLQPVPLQSQTGLLEDLPLPLLADVLSRGSFGHVTEEEAAFIVRGGDGAPACRLWQSRGLHFKAAFSGSVPAGTIAIVHTHPHEIPYPSAADHDAANRLGIPVLVLTKHRITAAMPGVRKRVQLVVDADWSRAVDPSRRCEAPFDAQLLGAGR